MSGADPVHQPMIVSLYGGIASGKTTVSRLFEDLGVTVIDTDSISHSLVAAGSPLLQPIRAHFGSDVFNADGTLDRRKLRERVFKHHQDRQWLESLLHPAILNEVKRTLQEVEADYCIVVIPLLVENGLEAFGDHNLLVDVTQSVQLHRLTQRDDISATLATEMIHAQASREERMAAADSVIMNADKKSALNRQVQVLHRSFTDIAHQTKRSGHDRR